MRCILKYCLFGYLLMGLLSPIQAQDIMPTAKERAKQNRKKRVILFDNDLRAKELAPEIVVLDTVVADSLADSQPKVDSTVIRLAFLLPLHADAIKRDKNMDRFYDFYAGALIAIYEQQQKGLPMEIFTYDVGKTALRTSEVLQQHPEILPWGI